MELQKNTLRYQRQVTRQTAYREETAESIVPDTLPDIARIVDVSVNAYIRDWEIGSDVVTVKCAMRATTIYVSETDQKLYKIETPLSVTQRIELRGAEPGCELLCSCTPVSADARAVNPRKISVRVNLAITPKLYAQTEESFTVDIDEKKECCIKTQKLSYGAIAAVSYKNFTLVEDVDIPESAGSISAVLYSDLKIRAADIKLMANRVIVKAEADVTALCENAEGEYITITRSFGFTQMADVPGAEEDLSADVEFTLRSFELDPAMDMSGGSRYLALSAGVMMNIEISKTAGMQVVTDLYGMRRESALSMRDIVLPGLPEVKSYKAYAKEQIDAAISIQSIVSSRVQTDETVEHLPGESTAAIGSMVSLLCLGDDGSYYNITKRLLLVFDCGEDAPSRIKVEDISLMADMLDSGGLEIELQAKLSAGEEKLQRISMVDAVEWGEEFPQDIYSRMSALIRRVTGGETLWDIAREYRTTVDAIALANKLDVDGMPGRGELLLIPMKK